MSECLCLCFAGVGVKVEDPPCARSRLGGFKGARLTLDKRSNKAKESASLLASLSKKLFREAVPYGCGGSGKHENCLLVLANP